MPEPFEQDEPFTKEQVEGFNRYSHFDADINKEFKADIHRAEDEAWESLKSRGIEKVPDDVKNAMYHYRKALYNYYLEKSRSRSVAPPVSVVGPSNYRGNVDRANRIEQNASEQLETAKTYLRRAIGRNTRGKLNTSDIEKWEPLAQQSKNRVDFGKRYAEQIKREIRAKPKSELTNFDESVIEGHWDHVYRDRGRKLYDRLGVKPAVAKEEKPKSESPETVFGNFEGRLKAVKTKEEFDEAQKWWMREMAKHDPSTMKKIETISQEKYGVRPTTTELFLKIRGESLTLYKKGNASLEATGVPVLFSLKDDPEALTISKKMVDFIAKKYPDKELEIKVGHQPISVAGPGGFRIGIPPKDASLDMMLPYSTKVGREFEELEKQGHPSRELWASMDFFHELGHTEGITDEKESDRFALKLTKEYLRESKETKEQIHDRLSKQADDLDRTVAKEISSYKPVGRVSELGLIMGYKPPANRDIVSTPNGTLVFKKDSSPSAETVKKWESMNKEAGEIRESATLYLYGLNPRPHTTTGNFRVVEHGRKLDAMGLLGDKDKKELRKLEDFWSTHPDLDRQKGGGVYDARGNIQLSESIKPKAPVSKEYGKLKVGQQIEVETPKGFVKGEITGFRSGDVGEDFMRVDVKTAERPYIGAHPNSIRVPEKAPSTKFQMKEFFEDLYVNKYGLPKPKITTVPDGIYIHYFGGSRAEKIFINEASFKENPKFYETYLEDVDDRIIHIVEKNKEKPEEVAELRREKRLREGETEKERREYHLMGKAEEEKRLSNITPYKQKWTVIGRHKNWVSGATIAESVDAGGEKRRLTATIRGFQNWKIYEGSTPVPVEQVVKRVEGIRDRIDAGDKTVYDEPNIPFSTETKTEEIKKEIKDEKQGAKEYKEKAQEAVTPKERKTYEGMAKDEERHARQLESMKPKRVIPKVKPEPRVIKTPAGAYQVIFIDKSGVVQGTSTPMDLQKAQASLAKLKGTEYNRSRIRPTRRSLATRLIRGY